MHSSLAQLFPKDVLALGARVGDCQDELMPAERACITQAVAKRQKEFTAVRVLARQALAAFGIHDFALLPDHNRCPIWPDGIVGSITHTDVWCAVAVGRAETVGSLGLDMERIDRVTPQLWEKILTTPERAWLTQQPEHDQVRLASTIFSAKEAYYKFQYPLTKRWLGFEDVEIRIEAESQITALVPNHKPQMGHHLRHADCVLSGCCQFNTQSPAGT